jgi:class 3 adenylate cyclase
MSWNYESSLLRIQDAMSEVSVDDIEVEKLKREMDLDNLSVKRCREIRGAHVYVDVSNFPRLVSTSEVLQKDDYKRLIRCVHLYQRELSRILETDFDGVKVHFQGPKLHALFYRPIDNDQELAARALLLALVAKDFVKGVFNAAFDEYDDFSVSSGIDIGDVVATKNGTRGDRELLFIGSPANNAAKITAGAGSIRLTKEMFEALPDALQCICCEAGHDLYKASAAADVLAELLGQRDIDWSRQKSAQRLKRDLKGLPLDAIQFSSARQLIDKSRLSVRNNKRVLAASLFADIAGFTGFIESADTEQTKKEAVWLFHMIRKEMREVVVSDYKGVRIQYQGDRIQGLYHLPEDDQAAIAKEAVEAAAGLQASMEHSLPRCVPECSELHLAIGIDIGKTLVSNLGQHGQRDMMCIGETVERASEYEDRLGARLTGISKDLKDSLPDEWQALFDYDAGKKCYVAKGLTTLALERVEKAKAYDAGMPFVITRGGDDVRISPGLADREDDESSRTATPTKTWRQE